ncbi:MAG: hypothetical protein ACQESE_05180 [Nanobdellota archaeon]
MKDQVVVFIDKKTEHKFETLKSGTYEKKKLYSFIKRAIADLKDDPACGVKIPKKLWPQSYVKKYGVTNLWKYDLPNAWRLIYTIQSDEITIMNIILDWFSHKKYERKFNYVLFEDSVDLRSYTNIS